MAQSLICCKCQTLGAKVARVFSNQCDQMSRNFATLAKF